MKYEDVKVIYWNEDPIGTGFQSFQEFCIREGFKYIFSSPMGDSPTRAIAAKTPEALEKATQPFEGIQGFGFDEQ